MNGPHRSAPPRPTGGRSGPGGPAAGLDVATLIISRSAPSLAHGMQHEHKEIVRRCRDPLSVAELGAHLGLDFTGFDRPDQPTTDGSQLPAESRSVKVMIAGGFGTGKTTMVRSVSDIKPLTTEETLTQASIDVDHLIGVADKTETTVSLDFGRIGLNEQLVLYLFGTPGQERFWFLWNGLFKGALGAVVLVDTRRLASSFRAIEEMERQGVPLVIALIRHLKERSAAILEAAR